MVGFERECGQPTSTFDASSDGTCSCAAQPRCRRPTPELGELERLLAAADEGITGQCRSCGAVHSRGAVYCWKCGQPLMLEAASAVIPPSEAQTQVLAPLVGDQPLSRGG